MDADRRKRVDIPAVGVGLGLLKRRVLVQLLSLPNANTVNRMFPSLARIEGKSQGSAQEGNGRGRISAYTLVEHAEIADGDR